MNLLARKVPLAASRLKQIEHDRVAAVARGVQRQELAAAAVVAQRDGTGSQLATADH
jgi:hypothetical protein